MKPLTLQRKTRQGFTLMEILVVLGILVVLLAMVGPRVLSGQKKADISNTKAQILSLKGCLDHYALDMKDFPTTEQGLQALVAPAASDGTEKTSSRWAGPYISSDEIPKDPWGNDYQYEYPPTRGTSGDPDIWSYGPDGEDNTADDIVSWRRAEGEEGAPVDAKDTGARETKASDKAPLERAPVERAPAERRPATKPAAKTK